MNSPSIPESFRSGNISGRPLVCIQGLGFVGAAMAAAVAMARTPDGEPAFDVVGVDLASDKGRIAIDAINSGRFPFETLDPKLDAAIAQGRAVGNLSATDDDSIYARAAVVCVDVHLDVIRDSDGKPVADHSIIRKAAQILGARISADCLVMVETTVPPGTCDKVVMPALRDGFAARGLDPDRVLLAHSYERVMPGENYLDSIVNFWRVFAANDERAGAACQQFLSRVINVAEFPLTRLDRIVASETAKVLENSYRATTIAFMEEWGRFAEAVGIDMFQIVDAIRQRPTHSNMRTPGFGVGGYCLTKDPLLTGIAARDLFGLELDFPLSRQAVEINARMPLASLDLLQGLIGDVAGKTVLVCGVSYRPGVADTRYAPAEILVRELKKRGATVLLTDPLVGHWDELGVAVPRSLPPVTGIDGVVFAVEHREYRDIDIAAWLGSARPAVVDASNVLTAAQRQAFKQAGCRVAGIGRGELS